MPGQNTQQTDLWYVASPIQTYNTPLYSHMREVLPASLEKLVHAPVELLYAEGMYRSAQHWLETWPVILQTRVTGGTVFFTDADRYIGRGVYVEIQDTLKKGLPVFLALPDGKLLFVPTLRTKPQHKVHFSPLTSNWKHYSLVTVRGYARSCNFGIDLPDKTA